MPKRGLNVPENDIECEFFTVISIDYLLVYEDEYYLHIHLDNYAHKIENKKLLNILMRNFSKIKHHKVCITIKLMCTLMSTIFPTIRRKRVKKGLILLKLTTAKNA